MLPPPGLGRNDDLDDANDGVDGVDENVEVGWRAHGRLVEEDPVHGRDEEGARRAHRVKHPVDAVDPLVERTRADGNRERSVNHPVLKMNLVVAN